MLEPITAVTGELGETLAGIAPAELNSLAERILGANRVFVAGAGRSGMMARCFCMRLMHLGLEAYMVGEVVTPAITRGDLLVIASGSGTTASLVNMAEKAVSLGAEVAAVTIYPQSPVAALAGAVVVIHAPTAKSEIDNGCRSIQPMGSLFEQCLLLCLDYVVLILMDKKQVTGGEMFRRHANLE